jgi:hypothetical protein
MRMDSVPHHPLYTRWKIPWYPLSRRVSGPQNWFRQCGERIISAPTRTGLCFRHYIYWQWDFHSCLLATMEHRYSENLIFLINFCVNDTKFHQNWWSQSRSLTRIRRQVNICLKTSSTDRDAPKSNLLNFQFFIGVYYPQKLALTSPTSGGRSVGIGRLRTKGHGVS